MKARWDLTLVFIAAAVGIGYGLGHVMPNSPSFTTQGESTFVKTEKFDEVKFKKDNHAGAKLPATPSKNELSTDVTKNRDQSLDTVDQAREYLKKLILSPQWDRIIQSPLHNSVAKVILPDGTTINVFFDSSGAITLRNIQFIDGARIWTEYDDHGMPTQSYWISAPPAFASQPI